MEMYKRIFSSIREYKKYVILTPLLVAIEVVLEVLMPFMMAWIIDDGINKGDIGYITKIGIILLIMATISLITGVMAGRYAAVSAAGFSKNLRFDIFSKVQKFSFKNIDGFSTSGLVTRLTTDITNIQNAFQMMTRIIARSPIMLGFSMFMATRINMKVAMTYFYVVPFLALVLFLIIRKAHPIFVQVFDEYDNLNKVVQENVSGIRVVKSYAREDEEIRKFDKMSRFIYDLFIKAEKYGVLTNPAIQFSIFTMIISISWISSKQIIAGSMTTGQLMALITYSWQILNSLVMFSFLFIMIIISRTSMERINQIYETELDLVNGENPVMEVPNGDINFENVYFSYVADKNKCVLKNININIKSGETVGIIGGTGSGKSTLVQLIPRLYDIVSGTIKVGGINVEDYDLQVLRDSVAMVLQKNVLFSGTIKENLKWGNHKATDEEIIKYCKLAQAHDFIMSFPNGYDTVLDQGGTNLSGGQRQRITIARALLKEPKILILDDSTSAVDTKTDSSIRKAFREEIPNTTKLIIAQRIQSIEESDKIIIIDNGQIVAIGSPKELLENNEIYQQIYYSQQKGGLFDESK